MGADTMPDEADALLALAEECGLTPAHARGRMTHIVATLRGWRAAARSNGVGERDIALLAEALDARIGAVESSARS